MGEVRRQDQPGMRWLVYARGTGGFDYMPSTTPLLSDERLIARGLTLAQAIAKVDQLNEADQ